MLSIDLSTNSIPVPLSNIPSHNILDGAKQPSKGLLAEGSHAQRLGAGRADSRGTRLAIEQRQFCRSVITIPDA